MLLLSNEKGLGLLYKVGLAIDGVIYNFISKLYKIFCDLSESTLFSSESYGQIASNLYVVIGVVMLFVLSYSLLKAIANPDDFSKGDSAFQNIVKNVIVTIVIIALLPTLFRVASYVQVTIVNKNTIGQIILGDYLEDDNINMDNVGASQIAIPIFKAFFHKDSYGEETTGANEPLVSVGPNSSGDPLNLGKSYDEIFSAIESDDSNFSEFRKSDTVINEVKDGTIEYSFPFSTFAGIFVVWVLLLFCIDLGIRVVKLAFYQIIAPVPAMCRILPGSNNKKIWDNWVKVTLATYMEIFIRIGVLYLGVYFIMLVAGTFDNQEALVSTNHSHAEVLIKALIIMGVIAFMRQAPKLISDIFGFDSSNMNLGLKGLTGRLGVGGALATGAAVGSIIPGAMRRFKDLRSQGKGVFRSAVGGVGGGLSAGTRAGIGGMSSKNIADARKASQAGINSMSMAGHRFDSFTDKASHPGETLRYWASGGSTKDENDMKQGAQFKKLNDAVNDSAVKMRDKNRSNANVLNHQGIQNAMNAAAQKPNGKKEDFWKNQAIAGNIQQVYEHLLTNVYGRDFSLAELDKYIEGESALSRSDFQTEADFINHNMKMEALEAMRLQLEDVGTANIINAANGGTSIAGVDQSKLLDVKSNVENFTSAFQYIGGSVMDKTDNNKKYVYNAKDSDTATQLKNITDAFDHNASLARRNEARREQERQLRGGGDKK